MGSEEDMIRGTGQPQTKSEISGKADVADNIFMEDVRTTYRAVGFNILTLNCSRSYQPSLYISPSLWSELALSTTCRDSSDWLHDTKKTF